MGKKKEGFELMKDRARQFAGDLYTIKEPEPAIRMLAQLLAEVAEWLRKYGDDAKGKALVAEAWIPAFGAACDTMTAVDKYLRETTDVSQVMRDNAKLIREALALTGQAINPSPAPGALS